MTAAADSGKVLWKASGIDDLGEPSSERFRTGQRTLAQVNQEKRESLGKLDLSDSEGIKDFGEPSVRSLTVIIWIRQTLEGFWV
jgi:hypothetical protein